MQVKIHAETTTVTKTQFAVEVEVYDPDQNYAHLALIQGRVVEVEKSTIDLVVEVPVEDEVSEVEQIPAQLVEFDQMAENYPAAIKQ